MNKETHQHGITNLSVDVQEQLPNRVDVIFLTTTTYANEKLRNGPKALAWCTMIPVVRHFRLESSSTIIVHGTHLYVVSFLCEN